MYSVVDRTLLRVVNHLVGSLGFLLLMWLQVEGSDSDGLGHLLRGCGRVFSLLKQTTYVSPKKYMNNDHRCCLSLVNTT